MDESTLFKSLAIEWMQDRKAVIKETTYLRDLSVFEKDLFPALGDMPIDQIKGKDVLACAKKLKSVVHWKWQNALFLYSSHRFWSIKSH